VCLSIEDEVKRILTPVTARGRKRRKRKKRESEAEAEGEGLAEGANAEMHAQTRTAAR
jgi:hypothetical protein